MTAASGDSMRRLDLDQLPNYTGWVARLLNAPSKTLFEKSKSSIYREYEADKWSALAARIETSELSLNEIELLQFNGQEEIAISMGSDLFVARPLDARRALAKAIADKAFPHRSGKSTIAELGAGTGAIIIRIAQDPRFAGSDFVAADFSPSSLKLIDHLARTERVAVRTGHFDFHETGSALSLPEGCILILSFTVAYVQDMTDAFWGRLASIKPRAIIVAEPIYQFYAEGTLLGLLRRRYYEANDYNQMILPTIEDAQRKGLLTVADIEENVIGINPLCPISLISLLIAD